METNPQIVLDIPLRVLVDKYQPFQSIPYMWNHVGESWENPITESEVRDALAADTFRPELTSGTRMQHIQRIAYLAHKGWDWALSVRVNLPTADAPGSWELIDGY